MTRAAILMLLATSACEVAPSDADPARPSTPVDDLGADDDHLRPEGTSRLPDHPAEADADTAVPDEVDGPAAPSCTILAPADGAEVPAGVPVHFEGEVVDADGDVRTVTWRSDVWGAMVIGTSFDFELPAAEHVVTMRAVDAGGLDCAASVRLVVR